MCLLIRPVPAFYFVELSRNVTEESTGVREGLSPLMARTRTAIVVSLGLSAAKPCGAAGHS